MKKIAILFMFFSLNAFSQNLNGSWYGRGHIKTKFKYLNTECESGHITFEVDEKKDKLILGTFGKCPTGSSSTEGLELTLDDGILLLQMDEDSYQEVGIYNNDFISLTIKDSENENIKLLSINGKLVNGKMEFYYSYNDASDIYGKYYGSLVRQSLLD
ncbi:hypothetical protein HBN50_11075 [Halobacteriovorax sp. GB3]|uniref:hypothetical protein n=1 Tax=Halobacteriovorax sp. GB3 TaxID=2719615 RepID=UPI00235F11CA|nr:hypothetical protein [Halobacteriovorax sp. GB3]MDD0853645.1 hypothetical protein [Halobacteriovorax sp. GB3]